DLIPDYKFKQGAILENIDLIKEYKTNIKDSLDSYLGDEVIDLRAGYYDKFYKPSASTITYKFLKDGKVVSHWVKHYRGLVVKELAKANIQNFAELMTLEIDGLKLLEIQEKKNIKTFIMQIV
ncbi:MAG: peroxide stress protein YaaA, partial [Campylobacterota bacterium]|nr:peroxide stress protein YaaA [Campylobacterota bacterium]